jgi:hypothetical protein
MKMLLILKSKPLSICGGGIPSCDCHSSGCHILPAGDCVWKSFCHMDNDEKHILTRILMPRAAALAESARSNSETRSSDGEDAQKQVTKRSSFWQLARMYSHVEDKTEKPVPDTKFFGVEVLSRARGVGKIGSSRATREVSHSCSQLSMRLVMDCED